MVSPNTSATPDCYVAILKAKRGELRAISGTAADRFVPLLEVLDGLGSAAIAKAWPSGGDVVWLQPINSAGLDEDSWARSITQLFDDLRQAGVPAVPAVTVDEDAQTYAAVSAIVLADQRGMCLRVDCELALDEDPSTLESMVDRVLKDCGLQPADVDLVVDAGLVQGAPAVLSNAVSSALLALPHVDAWRNAVAAFSGFPEVVGQVVPKSTVQSLPRTDAAAFRQLVARWTGRQLLFADYAVGVPTYANVAFSPIPNIRYAAGPEWFIHRAQSRSNPSPQYRALAGQVAAAPYFSGGTFSPGDQYIADVASGADGLGNAESYLRAGMSRHFHVVLDSLATHGAP